MWKKTIKEFLLTVIVSMSLVLVFNQFFSVISVDGISMDDTFKDGEYKISLKEWCMGEIAKGDIVFFEGVYEGEPIFLVKRVLGVPGDEIEIKDDNLYINGLIVREDYIKEPMKGSRDFKVELDESMYFVMGDNRNHSMDSRDIGPIPFRAIRGKVLHF